MSQAPNKPIRQEYITRVRYTNNLPPIPLNPKFVEYNTTEKISLKKESRSLMSSLFRKENFHKLIDIPDEEYGSNLNLIANKGILKDDKDDYIYPKGEAGSPVSLHPKDRALLRDAGIDDIVHSNPDVSFLRRTEYISEEHTPKISVTDTQSKSVEQEEKHDPESQTKAVEKTFNDAQDSLNNWASLRHPTKKRLKPVAAWSLLPDTSMMDTKFQTIKFSGSASISREIQALKNKFKGDYDDSLQKNSFSTSLFKPITNEDGEWISLYKADDREQASQLKSQLSSTEKEHPVTLLDEDEGGEEYGLEFYRNYDSHYQQAKRSNEELSIKFVPSNDNKKRRAIAYYYPMNGRIEMKKYRQTANAEVTKFVKDNTYDKINLKLREPNTTELKRMDKLRSEFDPIQYEGDDEEFVVDGEKQQRDDDSDNEKKQGSQSDVYQQRHHESESDSVPNRNGDALQTSNEQSDSNVNDVYADVKAN